MYVIVQEKSKNWCTPHFSSLQYTSYSVRIIESNYRGNLTEGIVKSVRIMEVSSYREYLYLYDISELLNLKQNNVIIKYKHSFAGTKFFLDSRFDSRLP